MNRFNLPAAKNQEEPNIDPDALRQFAAGAKEHRTNEGPPPWEAYAPDDVPKNSVSVRLNDYQLAMLRYIAQQSDVSQQRILNRILVPAIEEKARALQDG